MFGGLGCGLGYYFLDKFPELGVWCYLEPMVFTVSPGAHVRCPPGEGLEGGGASLIDSAEDLSVFYYFGCTVMLDPFDSSVVDSVGGSGDNDPGIGS